MNDEDVDLHLDMHLMTLDGLWCFGLLELWWLTVSYWLNSWHYSRRRVIVSLTDVNVLRYVSAATNLSDSSPDLDLKLDLSHYFW